MKNSLIVFSILVATSMELQANSLEGKWEARSCDSYGDSTFNGTFNYIFYSDFKMETFVQYYEDSNCTRRVTLPSITTRGTYQILGQSRTGESDRYRIKIVYPHMDQDVTYNLIITDNAMKICRDNNRCQDYVRRGL